MACGAAEAEFDATFTDSDGDAWRMPGFAVVDLAGPTATVRYIDILWSRFGPQQHLDRAVFVGAVGSPSTSTIGSTGKLNVRRGDESLWNGAGSPPSANSSMTSFPNSTFPMPSQRSTITSTTSP